MGDIQRKEQIDRQRKEQIDRLLSKIEAGEFPGASEATFGDWAWLAAIVVCGVVVWIALVKLGVAIVSAFL